MASSQRTEPLNLGKCICSKLNLPAATPAQTSGDAISEHSKPLEHMGSTKREISAKDCGSQDNVTPTGTSSTPAGAGNVAKQSITIDSDYDEGGPVVKPGVSKRKGGDGANVAGTSITAQSIEQESDGAPKKKSKRSTRGGLKYKLKHPAQTAQREANKAASGRLPDYRREESELEKLRREKAELEAKVAGQPEGAAEISSNVSMPKAATQTAESSKPFTRLAGKKTDNVIEPKRTETSQSLEDDPKDPATSTMLAAAVSTARDNDSKDGKPFAQTSTAKSRSASAPAPVPHSIEHSKPSSTDDQPTGAQATPNSDNVEDEENDPVAELAFVEKQPTAQLELNSNLTSRVTALVAKHEKVKTKVLKVNSAGKDSKQSMAMAIVEKDEEIKALKEMKETLEYKTDQCKDLQESQEALEKHVKAFFEAGDRTSDQRKVITEIKAEGKADPAGLSEKRRKALRVAEAVMAELKARLMEAGSVMKAAVGMEDDVE